MPHRNHVRRMLAALTLMVIFGVAAMAAETPIAIYVAPEGNDAAAGSREMPVKTLTRARDMIRAMKKAPGGLKAPLRVVLKDGTYVLEETLVLTAEDSGSESCPITYAADAGARPLLSGGQTIGRWKAGKINGRDCLVGDVGPKARFKELFVGGQRRPQTRLPKEGHYRFDAANLKEEWRKPKESYKFVKGDLKNWTNLGDVDLVILNRWVDGHCKLARVDEAAGVVHFTPHAALSVTDSKGLPARYYVLNVKEALTEPGQWYLDRPTGKLYYLPQPGETAETLVATAPHLETLLRLEGRGPDKVRWLRFENLAFSYAETASEDSARQAAVTIPGAVTLADACDVTFHGCEFTHIGSYVAEVGAGCADNRLIACLMQDLGAGGVKLNEGSQHTTVADCTIRQGGRIWHAAVGVLVGNSAHNRIVHNEIADFFYTGVSVGWVWGYGPTLAADNRIEYNHIHTIGHGLLDDMGGIYTLGTQAGTVLRGNVIHDVSNYGYGGWGIYTDEGSSGLLIEGNLVYRTQTGGFHQHYGRDNIVRNNIFALATEKELRRSRFERIQSFLFEKNIVYVTKEAKLLDGKWEDGNYTMRGNIFWRDGGGVLDFNGQSLAQWQRSGCDSRSVVADPLFENPAAGNFTLKPQTPALKVGFKPIDVKAAGPRAQALRKAEEEPPRPVLEGRLEDEPFGKVRRGGDRFSVPRTLSANQPCPLTYQLWNRGRVAARGQVAFRILPPDVARIEGQTTLNYDLKPGEKIQVRMKVTSKAKDKPTVCRLVAIPRGEGLVPSIIYFAGGKK